MSLVPVLLGITLAVFFVMRLIPGDAALARLGDDATPELLAQYRQMYGLDSSLIEQLLDWLKRVVRFDFGLSLMTNRPILQDILIRLPATLELTLVATVISILVGMPLGIASAWWRNGLVDFASRLLSLLGLSIPNFWLALLLILWISLTLGWLPASGYVSFSENPARNLRAIILPSVTLGVGMAAVVARFTRSSVLEVLRRDYIRTARGKGVSPRGVLLRHALKNALIPVVTIVGVQMGTMLGGTVIIEDIFAWPGLGRFALEAIYNRDYYVIQTAVLFMATFYVLINFLVDITYTLLNPQIEYG